MTKCRCDKSSNSLALLPVVLLAIAGCVLLMVSSCDAHGFLVNPLSRARVLGYDEYTASSGNAGGAGAGPRPLPGVCGDPHQDNTNLNLANRPTSPQATYSSGSTISVTFRPRVNHGGWIGIKICPSTRSNPSQSCFDQYPLTKYVNWQSRCPSLHF